MQIIYIIILLLLDNLVNAQGKIEGLGKFKVGVSTINVIDEVAAEFGTKVTVANTIREMYATRRGTNIVEVGTNTNNVDERPEESPYCPDVRVFYIDNYVIADVPLEKIYLTFKNNKLIKIKVEDSTKLMEAVQAKYGEGQPAKTELDPTSCKSDMDGSYLKSIMKSTVWRNEDIVARQYSINAPNRYCKIKYSTGFSIELEPERAGLKACEQSGKTKAEAVNQKVKKDKLKDF